MSTPIPRTITDSYFSGRMKNRSLPESRYDLTTYWGRVQHFAEVSSPLLLFHSNETIRRAQQALRDYESGKREKSAELWADKQLVDSSVHPDTGEIVFLPFRMSSYVLSNLVVTVGMLTPNLGTAGTLFWQVANQSLNVAVNTANANKSHPLTTSQLIKSYFAAVSASCGVALGLNALVTRLQRVSPGTKAILTRLIPFAAVVSAGWLNVTLMRSSEMIHGITVYDQETNEPLGNSKAAARRAVFETAASRAINAMPVMAVPPLVLLKLQRTRFLRGRSNFTVNAVNVGLIAATSFAVLPFALGIFPQRRLISGDKLEPEFKGKNVVFNRGV